MVGFDYDLRTNETKRQEATSHSGVHVRWGPPPARDSEIWLGVAGLLCVGKYAFLSEPNLGTCESTDRSQPSINRTPRAPRVVRRVETTRLSFVTGFG